MLTRKELYLICTLFIAATISAQKKENHYNFRDIEESITQRAVSTIVQDSKGLIWMGTYGVGLNMYNGLDIVSYKQEFNNPHSLNSSLVQTAYVDSAGRMWVGTETGLNIFKNSSNSFDQVNFYRNNNLISNLVITSIVEIDNKKLLVGTIANGLFEVEIDELNGYSIKMGSLDTSPLIINALIRDTEENIYIGTNNGLYIYNKEKIIDYAFDNKLYRDVKNSHINVESMLIDNDGALWLGTHSKGIIKIVNPQKKNNDSYIIDLTSERILTMVQSPDGNILCGTENDGLFVIKKNGDLVHNYRYDKFNINSIKSNSVWSLFVDKQERIWIGYYNKGVGLYDYNFDKFDDIQSIQNVENSLQSSSVTGIIKDDHDRLWIAMDGGGIDVYDLETKKIVHLLNRTNAIATKLTADDIQTIFLDSRGNIWAGTWNSGIFYLPTNSKTFRNFTMSNTGGILKSNRIMSFSEDVNGKIWIGTFSNGLHYYDLNENQFGNVEDIKFPELKTNRAEIRKVMVDHQNMIWVATTSGLFKRQANSNTLFEKIALEPGQSNPNCSEVIVDVIVSLYEDSENNVWIGTDGAGIWKYDTKENSLKWFYKNEGLEQETIATILEDNQGKIWMAGNKGISCYNRDEKLFTTYDINDGLLTNDFNFNSAFKDLDGSLYFGNYKGVNIVRPSNLPTNNSKPEVYFTDFKIYNKSVSLEDKNSPLEKVIAETNEITLNHRQSVFTIEFIGINYTRPEKNQYAYYLEGLEEDWNYVGNSRNATYTNLSPGEYTFKVKAANNDGVWNDQIKTLSIQILAPWWKTNLALTLYLILFSLFSSWLYRLLKARIREKRQIQFEREKRIQEEELNNRKIQFFTNISHEFRTPLTLILNPLKDIMSNPKYSQPNEIYDRHNIIYKNATRLKRLIDELMDFRKLQLNKFSIKVSQIEINTFIQEITDHFKEEAILKNIALLLEKEKTPIQLWSDPSMLEKIVFNILSNAFKVTPENGTITINVFRSTKKIVFPLIDSSRPQSALEIHIEDTGSGINQEEVKKIFNRFYQVKNMNSQYYGGTGIGLEVVRNFVALLKGEILIESEESVGTKFKILLPLGKNHFTEEEIFCDSKFETLLPTTDILKIPSIKKESEKIKRTVLLVEDNTELRVYLKNELSYDYTVLEASNGKQALELANRKIPDLIITDVVMPEMDGIEFSSILKSHISTSHIPIIMLTAKTMMEDKVKGVDSGADVYLTKPFDMRLLNSYLVRLIENRQVYISKNLNDPNKLTLLEKTTELDKSFMQKVLDYLNKNLDKTDLNVEYLADDMHLSRSQLYRKIKAMTGLTPNELIRKLRLEKAKKMIESGCESISEVGFKVGFSSPSYFSRCFKSEFGILPTEVKTK